MTPRDPIRRPAGFTLIELLLAMSMVVVLTASLYAGMAAAFRARVVVNAQTESLRQAKAALDLAEQDLRSVLPPGGTFAGAFYGTAGGTGDTAAATIDCYTLGSDSVAPLDGSAPDGVRHVVLALGYDDTTPSLTRTVTRDLLGGNGGTADYETLARNVEGFDAKYYDGQAWADSWDSTQQSNALPVAVELTVSVKSPTTTDPNHVYKLSRIVPLACGLTPDQATAVATAASNDTAPAVAGTDTTGQTTGTGTSSTGGTP